jgi:type I restriction enzyme S subunit
LGDKRVLLIEPGDLVFNNVFAWEGAVAVAGPNEAGMIGSHRYITYKVNRNLATAEYLKLYFTTERGREVLIKASPGSAGRNKTLGLDRFIINDVPLPPLAEQRLLVAQIEELTACINEARQLRQYADRMTNQFKVSSISRILDEIPLNGCLGDVLLGKPRNGWSAKCDGLDTGTPILSLGAVTGYRYRPDQYKWTSEATISDAHYWLRKGDLLITRSNTPDLVGHAAIYNGQPEGCIYPDLMMRLDVDEQRSMKTFVLYVLKSGRVRKYIRGNAKGTSPTMKKISQSVVMNIPFPSKLDRLEQKQLIKELDKIEGRTEELIRLQEQSSKELNALLPAALKKVFEGEL